MVLLLVLAAPLAYKAAARTGENICVDVRARWFYGVLGVKYIYKDNIADQQFYIFNRKIKNEPKQIKKDATGRGPDEKKRYKEDKVKSERTTTKRRKKTEEKKSETGTGFLSVIKNYPDKKALLSKTLLLVKQLLKTARPKYFKLGGEIGFDAPHHTGYLLAFLGVVRGMRGFDIDITPDMKGRAFDITLNANGRVSLMGLCLPVAAFALSRPVRRLIGNYIKNK